MTLRKITIDNGVKYSPQKEQTQERDNKPTTIKEFSLLVNKTKKFHKMIKNSSKK